MLWRCRDRAFVLRDRTLFRGIVNIPLASFSDAGRSSPPGGALARARRLLEEGADLLDLGAESTRPGSQPVPADEQWQRVRPVIAALRRTHPDAVLSIDTRSAAVAARALDAGARIVNDVSALGDPEMGAVVARAGA